MNPSTDFARFGHEQLFSMLQGNNPALILGSADSFDSLAVRVTRSIRSLSARVHNLDWHGESAEAFRQWAQDVLQAADELSNFARQTGQQLRAAGEQLAGTRLPPVNPNDLILAKSQDAATRTSALQRLDSAKAEAVRQMQALGSTYRVAAEGLSALKEPRFPQPANLLGLDVQTLNTLQLGNNDENSWTPLPDSPSRLDRPGRGHWPEPGLPAAFQPANFSDKESNTRPFQLKPPEVSENSRMGPNETASELLSTSGNTSSNLPITSTSPTTEGSWAREASRPYTGSTAGVPIHPTPTGQTPGKNVAPHLRNPLTSTATSSPQAPRTPRATPYLAGPPLVPHRPSDVSERHIPQVEDVHSLALDPQPPTIPPVIQ